MHPQGYGDYFDGNDDIGQYEDQPEAGSTESRYAIPRRSQQTDTQSYRYSDITPPQAQRAWNSHSPISAHISGPNANLMTTCLDSLMDSFIDQYLPPDTSPAVSTQPPMQERGQNPRNSHGVQLKPVSLLRESVILSPESTLQHRCPADMYRSFFKFGVFNAMQSQCYDTVRTS